MRKYFFDFTASLAALSLGLLAVYLLAYTETESDHAESVKSIENSAPNSVVLEIPFHEQTGIEDLKSDREKAKLLFEPTLKKWLSGTDIASVIEPSSEIIELIENTKLHRYEAQYLTDRARRRYKPTHVDLNDDGRPELAILIDLEGSNDGDLWLFRKADIDFEVILHSREQLEMFELKKTISNGFNNIQTSYYPNDPQSETFKSMNEDKFDGKNYILRGCSAIVDRYRDKNGVDLHYLKKPFLEQFDDCC